MIAEAPAPLRKCYVCHQRHAPEAFYTDPSRRIGVTSKCRRCARALLRGLRLNGEPGTPKRREVNRRAEAHRQERELVDPEFAQRRHARRTAREAQKLGIIHRPGTCELCSAAGVPLEGHHPDHRDVLRVIFVCRPCHERMPHARPAEVA